MERQSKESKGLEAYCRGGQGPTRAVAPSGGDKNVKETGRDLISGNFLTLLITIIIIILIIIIIINCN